MPKSLTDKPAADRPSWQKWTVIGTVLYAVVQSLESLGKVPSGTGESLAGVADAVAKSLVVLGIYRHVAN